MGERIKNELFIQQLIKLLTIGWVIYHAVFFAYVLAKRPLELYQPLTWFGKVFSPVFPSIFYYYFVVLITLVSGIGLLKPNRFRPALTCLFIFGLLYVNSIRWSYGYFSHTGHAVILAVFLPDAFSIRYQSEKKVLQYFKWYYAGLLSTYSLSPFWKTQTLFMDVLYHNYENSWLNIHAVINTSVDGYVWMNEKSLPLFYGVFSFRYYGAACSLSPRWLCYFPLSV